MAQRSEKWDQQAREAGQRQSLFREVNDCIDELLHRHGSDDVAEFLCECPDGGCARRVPLTRHDFEAYRQAGLFVVAPECTDVCTRDGMLYYRVGGGPRRPRLGLVASV